jgi:ABC-type transport system substrate-binding protein
MRLRGGVGGLGARDDFKCCCAEARRHLEDAPRRQPGQASMSIHEESTIVSEGPMMAVFNTLVMFDQYIPPNRLDTIVPDLAAGWSWSEDGVTLTLKLRQGVRWHDGKPFTAKDVKCIWDLLQGRGRKNSGSTHANPGIRTSRK